MLLALAAGMFVPLGWLTVLLFWPSPRFDSSTAVTASSMVIAGDFSRWETIPIQDGRLKPFSTACEEIVRELTGRARFEGLDPVRVVATWMLLRDDRWEQHAFLLCDDRELRRTIADDLAAAGVSRDESWLSAKYVSPHDLRSSMGFSKLVERASQVRRELQGKAHLQMTRAELKAEEVARRLEKYDVVRGRSVTPLATVALIGERVVGLAEYAGMKEIPVESVVEQLEATTVESLNPFRVVGLDAASESAWFSISELKMLQRSPPLWRDWMQKRTVDRPESYLSAAQRETLLAIQSGLRRRDVTGQVSSLAKVLSQRREEELAAFDAAFQRDDRDETNRRLQQLLRDEATRQRFLEFRNAASRTHRTPAELHQVCLPELEKTTAALDQQRLDRITRGLQRAIDAGAKLDAVESQAASLECLEAFYPDLYRQVSDARPYPGEWIDRLLGQWELLRDAVDANDLSQFSSASTSFLGTLRNATNFAVLQGVAAGLDADSKSSAKVATDWQRVVAARDSEDWVEIETMLDQCVNTIPSQALADWKWYSTEGLLRWERWLQRWQPFRWAWIVMLLSIVLLLISGGMTGTIWYRAALTVFGVSLVLQTVGFVVRTAVAARAPVANMYETVIFVAFMAAVFALALELLYRSRVIALAGALVATLGLILADQLPLALDPKISPMVPVLRTNFWLTVHVLTIVASYAAGTLAWGLGNVSLGMLAFGSGSRLTLERLSQFTYRAMQLAVLLLAVGTFLGGCWAAESWGRFWGWDPKEVGALVALICYVIPLHARYVGWVRDFGLAVSAVLCYASIIVSWYVINFLLAAGLHSYGFSAGGGWGMLWATVLNLEWLLVTCYLYGRRPACSEAGAADRQAPAATSDGAASVQAASF